MDTYDFISKTITEPQVKAIIARAGYDPADYAYRPRVDHDGFVVQGVVVMSTTRLRQAALELRIRVEIYSAVDDGVVLSNRNGLHSGLTVDAGTPYEVDITMSQATVSALMQAGFLLYGFKAVQTTLQGGAPLVWFQTNTYAQLTKVQWSEQYEAYTSSSAIIPNGQITASVSVPITLGQTFQVDQAGGGGEVINGGTGGAISIHSLLSQEYTCGISQQQGGSINPLCAFPLYGGNLDVIAPIEKVLLMFSTSPVNTGTVIEQAYSPGFLIDLTGAGNNQRSVSYDINLGWSTVPSGAAWGQQVPAQENLVPLLINSSTSLSAFRRRLLAA